MKINPFSIIRFNFVMIFIPFLSKLREPLSRKFVLILLIAGLIPNLKAAFEKKDVGAVSIALGNATVAIDTFKTALYQNPACLSGNKFCRLMFSYQNYYGLADINEIDISVEWQLFQHPIAFAFNRFGNHIYQEVQFTTGSFIKIFDSFKIGLSGQLYSLSISGYGQSVSWGCNLAFLYYFTNSLSVGALVTNINGPVIGTGREKLPQTMSVGICYLSGENSTVSFEVFRDIQFEPEYRAGFSYQLMTAFILRGGMEDRLQSYACGFGLNYSWFEFDYAIKIHQILGVSHIISLSLCL